MFLTEQTKREENLKQRRLSKEKAKKPTKEAAIQCDRQETADSKLASEIGVQTDFSAVVMEDLREQVRQLTKIVADFTALKARDDRKHTSTPLLGEGILSDSLSDVVPFDSSDIRAVLETPPPPEPVNPACFVQDPVLQNISVSASQSQAQQPRATLSSQNNDVPPFPMRSPLSNVNQNVQVTHCSGPTDEQRRKVEAMVFMGSQVITTAMACVDALFTDEELANGNTSGSNGYRPLDDLKLRFLASALRQKFDSPVFTDQWETVKARINTKCRGKRRTVLRRPQKQTNF